MVMIIVLSVLVITQTVLNSFRVAWYKLITIRIILSIKKLSPGKVK